MYLNATTDKLEILLGGTITTNQLQWNVSYQDITSTGMTLPQSAGAGLTNNTTVVDMVAAPAASTTRQVTNISVFNADTVAAEVIIQKDVSGTNYTFVKSLLQAGDTLQWSREAGWTVLKRSDQESIILTEFIANGTWTKPQGLKRVLVCCVGAGGGGGSGRRGAAGTNRSGGPGGGGGAITWAILNAGSLMPTIAVTCGVGGTGGAGQTVDDTIGNAGTVGGDTSFGSIVVAKGGNGGAGGANATTTAAAAGGAAGTCVPSFGPFAITGAQSGGGAVATGTAGGSGFTGQAACPSGGGGSGIGTTNVSATTGGLGGNIYVNGALQVATPAATNGTDNVNTAFMFSTTIYSIYGVGEGGGGGFPASVDGGDGGNYGAGGGGGSGVLNGTVSGAGGDGGDGLVIVMEIY